MAPTWPARVASARDGGGGRGDRLTRLAAHRGGARLWPENSLRAFRESLALGVELLELDVHLSADGRAVVIHDPILDRTTEARGPVAARTAAELGRVRLRGPDGAVSEERLPTLEEVLRLAAPSTAGVLLEVKGPTPGVSVTYDRSGGEVRILAGPEYPGLVEHALAVVRQASMLDRVNVMGFSPDVVGRARAVAPGVATTFLVAAGHARYVDAGPGDPVAWASRLGATDVGVQHTLADAALMTAARAAGVRVGVWTVNDEPEMRRVIALGVDVLTTDRPDLARRVLGR
ncbi:MAG TPA: glycerophosphodiester phosphodiesterase family protein [Methylomirabilota bacterium]|nr:glycerophosphodiester phosphodiesterase family protein [Methylomirabilota bacterium]